MRPASVKQPSDEQARRADRKFLPGISGNPRGRPRGARDRLPRVRNGSVKIEVPAVIKEGAADLPRAAAALLWATERAAIRAAENGELTLAETARLASILEILSRVLERARANEKTEMQGDSDQAAAGYDAAAPRKKRVDLALVPGLDPRSVA